LPASLRWPGWRSRPPGSVRWLAAQLAQPTRLHQPATAKATRAALSAVVARAQQPLPQALPSHQVSAFGAVAAVPTQYATAPRQLPTPATCPSSTAQHPPSQTAMCPAPSTALHTTPRAAASLGRLPDVHLHTHLHALQPVNPHCPFLSPHQALHFHLCRLQLICRRLSHCS
jgi:hypothetical protein